MRAQADQRFRVEQEDIQRLKVRSSTGALVPLGTLVEVRNVAGPDLIQRYNLYTSVPLQGDAAPGVSTGTALDTMERLAREVLPQGTSFEWTELAFQERAIGNTALYIFALAVLLVFLVLAAQYESWGLPLAIVLVVPMAMLSALGGVWLAGTGQQHPHPDRPHRPRRARGQERDPDRRVRQAGRGRARPDARSRPPSKPAACACARS